MDAWHHEESNRQWEEEQQAPEHMIDERFGL
jgi:hypothetical protein